MTIEFRVYPTKDVVAVAADGRITFDDLLLSMKRIWENEEARGMTRKLMDLRRAAMSLDARQAMIASQAGGREAQVLGTKKIAILVNELMDRSLLRILKRGAEGLGVEVRFFYSEAPAINYLNGREGESVEGEIDPGEDDEDDAAATIAEDEQPEA